MKTKSRKCYFITPAESKPDKPVFIIYRGVGPQGTLATVSAGGARRAGVLAEVVVAGDKLAAEIAHGAATAAQQTVASFRLDQAGGALDTLPDSGGGHSLLAAAQRRKLERVVERDKQKTKWISNSLNICKPALLFFIILLCVSRTKFLVKLQVKSGFSFSSRSSSSICLELEASVSECFCTNGENIQTLFKQSPHRAAQTLIH